MDDETVDAELVDEHGHAGTIALAQPLTEQEAAVARLAATGMDPAEIAEELAIGVKAVHAYIRRATLKMQAGPFQLPERAIAAAGRMAAGLAGAEDPAYTLSPAADKLRREGVPQNTVDTKTYQWLRYVSWCGDAEQGQAHPRESIDDDPERAVVTVIEWINANWEMTRLNDAGELVGRGRNGQPYAPDTVRLSLSVISMAYQRKGKASPVHHPDAIEAMRGYHRRWRRHGFRPDRAYVLTTPEAIALVRACDRTTAAGLRDALLMRLADDVGRRNSELLSVTWADVSWESDSVMLISFPHSKTNRDDGKDEDRPVVVEHDVDLAPDVSPTILMREWMQLSAVRLGEPLTGFVFREVKSGTRRKDGTHSGLITRNQMTRKAFQDVVAKYAKITGVDREVDPATGKRTGKKRKVVPHSFRAKLASEGEMYGVPENDIADRAGWKRGSQSMRTYMRLGSGRGDRNPATVIRKALAAKQAPQEEAGE